jgi:hypothetical protein
MKSKIKIYNILLFLFVNLVLFQSCKEVGVKNPPSFLFSNTSLKKNTMKFIDTCRYESKDKVITVDCIKKIDTTEFYFFANTKPNFESANLIGFLKVGDVDIWLIGDEPPHTFISIDRGNSIKLRLSTKVIDSPNLIRIEHPRQLYLQYKQLKLIMCESNLSPTFCEHIYR